MSDLAATPSGRHRLGVVVTPEQLAADASGDLKDTAVTAFVLDTVVAQLS